MTVSPDNAMVVPAPRLPAGERRAQLALAAAARFHQLGYHHVSMADIAEEVGVTGPAVYRHFRNKQALLAAAIAGGLDLVEEALDRTVTGSLADLVSAVADVGLDRPDLWILLQRESKFLDPVSGARVHEQFARITDGFARKLRRENPTASSGFARLLVTAATAVLSSPVFGRTTLPRTVHKRELTASALAALRLAEDVGADRPDLAAAVAAHPQEPGSRRTEVVDKAIDLFYLRGYSAVTLDEIGAAVGMAGPSLYHHFATKADILVAAFERTTARLTAEQRRRAAAPHRVSLEDLVGSYTDFCLRNHAVVGLYVSEAINLPPSARRQTTAAIREGMREWTIALLALDGRSYEAVAKVRVNAALAAVHDLARLGHLHDRPRIAQEINAVARAILLRGAHG